MSGQGFVTDRREVLALAASAAVLPAAFGMSARAAEPAEDGLRAGRDQGFDNGWLFRRGTAERQEPLEVDDSQWRRVDLPHDWSIEDGPDNALSGQVGPFNPKAPAGTATGFTEGGEGWYRKHFRADGLASGSRVEILFEGIYGESEIWLNGQTLGTQVHGYTSFALDLTPHLIRGSDNVLAVRVRNLGKNSRWYSGSGLYRPVRIDVLPGGARLARWGVGAWTRSLTENAASIEVGTRVEDPDASLEVVARLRDAKGRSVAEARSAASDVVKQSLSVKSPRPWSPEDPYLYSLEVQLMRGDKVVDRIDQNVGIRIIAFDARQGMTINGKATKLRGGCVHHDNGLLGAAAFADADERRVLRLKARGYNAIRSAHNPAARSFREACDRNGMLLIEEAFDMWQSPKQPDDFSGRFKDHWQDVLTAMILSARNSPSVIMWSIGNEIPDRATPEGVKYQWELANSARRLDPTRPVTSAINGVLGASLIAGAATARPGRAEKVDNAATIFLDVLGYNYRLDDIEAEQPGHPERIVYASETFARDMHDYATLADRAPYFLGEFLWTAIDYLGEAGLAASAHLKKSAPPFYFADFPWINAWSGDIDLIGDQKAPSRARDVVWGLSPLEMAVQRPVADDSVEYVGPWGWSDELESWSWPDSAGKPLMVRIYSSGDRIDLKLNGKPVATRTLAASDKMRAEFSIAYEPGELEAVAYRGGTMIGRKTFATVSSPARVRVAPERPAGRRDRQALHYVALDVLDAKGRLMPDDMRKIDLQIDGPADLVAFGNANPLATGSFQSREAQTFRGRAMAILRSKGQAGTVRIEARADGLEGGAALLRLT